MLTHHVIHDGGAQSVVSVPIDVQGEAKLASSATYAIYNLRHTEDSTDRTVVASTSATIDSTSTTTDAAAGRGTSSSSAKLSVASVSGFLEGHAYLVTAPDGRTELVRVDHIDTSSANLHLVDELSKTFAVGSTVTGVEVTGTFPSAEAADDSEFDSAVHYAIDWVFAGVDPTRRRDLIKVRRTAERVYASVEDIKTLDVSLAPYSTDKLDLKRCLVQAHRDFRRVLRTRSIDPDTYNGGETARDAVVYRAAELARRQMGGDRDERLADDYASSYATIMQSLGGEGEVLTDRSDDDERFDLAEKLAPFGLT